MQTAIPKVYLEFGDPATATSLLGDQNQDPVRVRCDAAPGLLRGGERAKQEHFSAR